MTRRSSSVASNSVDTARRVRPHNALQKVRADASITAKTGLDFNRADARNGGRSMNAQPKGSTCGAGNSSIPVTLA
jgi:hypothetical protein